MIKVKHPIKEYNQAQEKFLLDLPQGKRREHELIFTYGNITYRYHSQAAMFEPSETDFKEWLQGLPEPIRNHCAKEGFDKCRTHLSFTRYVNEKHDIGIDEYVQKHMDLEDYREYMLMVKKSQ